MAISKKVWIGMVADFIDLERRKYVFWFVMMRREGKRKIVKEGQF
jgi:hypothetical protein